MCNLHAKKRPRLIEQLTQFLKMNPVPRIAGLTFSRGQDSPRRYNKIEIRRSQAGEFYGNLRDELFNVEFYTRLRSNLQS